MSYEALSPQELCTGKSVLDVISPDVIEPVFRALTSSTMWKELTCFLVGALKLAGELCPAVAAPVTDLCIQLQNKLLAA